MYVHMMLANHQIQHGKNMKTKQSLEFNIIDNNI